MKAAESTGDPELLYLGKGHPTPSLLPVDEIRAAIASIPARRAENMLKYTSLRGSSALRRDLAAFLGERYRHPVSADELALGSGISLNLSMACQVFARPGATVVCEEPTYFHAGNIFRTAGLEMVGIPIDRAGLRVDEFERRLAAGAVRPHLVYCIPSFHNPTGVCLAPERAERLVELADLHDFLIVADEPYVMLHFEAEPPPCMMSYDRGRGRVLSLGSFSKILAPGLRAGWVHGRPDLIERFAAHGALRSGGSVASLALAAIHQLLDSGFLAANIDRLRAVYGHRKRVLAAALRSHFDDPRVDFLEPGGGYFLWLELGAGHDSARFLDTARHHGVQFTPGARCAISRDLGHALRLCFAYLEAGDLAVGVDRLARAFRAFTGGAT